MDPLLFQHIIFDHCTAIVANRGLVLDRFEKYPMRLNIGSLRSSSGDEVEKPYIAEVRQVVCSKTRQTSAKFLMIHYSSCSSSSLEHNMDYNEVCDIHFVWLLATSCDLRISHMSEITLS